jgi:hypothetical protein
VHQDVRLRIGRIRHRGVDPLRIAGGVDGSTNVENGVPPPVAKYPPTTMIEFAAVTADENNTLTDETPPWCRSRID